MKESIETQLDNDEKPKDKAPLRKRLGRALLGIFRRSSRGDGAETIPPTTEEDDGPYRYLTSQQPLSTSEIPEEKKVERQPLTREKIETVLEDGEVINIHTIEQSTQKAILLELPEDLKGVFKPRAGETGEDAGTLCNRERAAYLVDKAIGFNLIPVTVLRKEVVLPTGERLGDGSIQLFIEDAEELREAEGVDYKVMMPLQYKLWILDTVTNNEDRFNGGELIKRVGQNGERPGGLYAIDNGSCFGDDPPGGQATFYGREAPPEVRELMNHFDEPGKRSELEADLRELLSDKEVDRCFERIELLTRLLREKGQIDVGDLKPLYASPSDL